MVLRFWSACITKASRMRACGAWLASTRRLLPAPYPPWVMKGTMGLLLMSCIAGHAAMNQPGNHPGSARAREDGDQGPVI